MYVGVPRGDTPGEGDGDGGPDGDRDRTGARGPTGAAGGAGGAPTAGTGVGPGNVGLRQPHSNTHGGCISGCQLSGLIVNLFITKTATGPGGSVIGGTGAGGGAVAGAGGRGPGVGAGGLPLGAGGVGAFKPGKSELQASFCCCGFVPNQHTHVTTMSVFFLSFF